MALSVAPKLPTLPLPPPLLANKPGTWAFDTMNRRTREEILGREVLEANAEALSSPEFKDAMKSLRALEQELASASSSPLRHLTQEEYAASPDASLWRETLGPLVASGKTWTDSPWVIAEFYFYRRLMESLGFFTNPASFFDPFLASKRSGLASVLTPMEALAPSVLETLNAFGGGGGGGGGGSGGGGKEGGEEEVDQNEQNMKKQKKSVDAESAFAAAEVSSTGEPAATTTTTTTSTTSSTTSTSTSTNKEEDGEEDDEELSTSLRLFTLISLWGNRMDLSLWPTGSKGNVADAFSQVLAAGEAKLLSDDFSQLVGVAARCRRQGGKRVDIIVDNAGFELVTDLLLADFLVASGIASTVVFQLKGHPTFVSDARASDLLEHVETMANLNDGDHPGCRELGQRWKKRLASGEWVLNEHLFWAQPGAMWEMPPELREELQSSSALVFTKGDANYRRLLGDRDWALSAPFQKVCGYFPTALCALRTLKAEIGVGMEEGQTSRAASEDAKWMINSKFGVIQVALPDA